jgi:plasmid stabilization system protein ParE
MTYSLQFLPEVEDDVIKSYSWYKIKSRALGEDFLRIFYASAHDIPGNPLLYPKVYKEFRRRLIRRFPYAIYFALDDDRIIVFGLFHCARNPLYKDGASKQRERIISLPNDKPYSEH